MNLLKNSTFRYAVSLAAGWAWGVSFVVGMQTVQEKGIIPFLIWATANSLSLPLFGWIAYRIPNLEKVVHSKPVQIFMTAIMIFCLWIQMNAIRQTLESSNIFDDWFCTLIPLISAVLLAIVLYKDGIIRNILIDNPLWMGCYILLVVILVYALAIGCPKHEIVLATNAKEYKWAFNSCLILFAGPIMNIQNWQMANKLKKENKMHAHIIAGIIFGIYMIIIFCLSFFEFDSFMSLIQVPVILCITLTTADAAIVGMQRIGGEKIGLVLSFLTIAVWPFLQHIGVLELWTFMGNARLYVAILCIILAYAFYFFQKKKGDKLCKK